MGTADVARLRFILSADAGGLKAGTKEGAGSLKDMESQTRRSMNAMDGYSPSWSGLKKSARSLKFAAREIGGMTQGGLRDVIGVASAGAMMGPVGAAVAAGAVGVNLYQSHQEQLVKDRQKASADYHGALSKGIDSVTYGKLSSIAGDDSQYLNDMASAMREIKEAGPNASGALKSLGKDIDSIGKQLGLGSKDDKELTRDQKVLRGEKLLDDLGHGGTVMRNLELLEKHFKEKFKQQGMSDKEASKRASDKMDTFAGNIDVAGHRHRNIFSGGEQYKDAMEEFVKDLDYKTERNRERTALMTDPNLQTNREKLNHKLEHLRDLQHNIDGDSSLSASDKKEYSLKIGRGTKDAMDEYNKAQGGHTEMAGAAVAGSTEAYSIVAHAQMAAAGAGDDTAKTNAILEKEFPELIKAVKATKSDWRKADTAN